MMSGHVLDTHALLWLVYKDERLSLRARAEMEKGELLWFSLVTFWEIAIKEGNRQFDFDLGADWKDRILGECERLEIREITLTAEDCRAVQDLPKHHRDPFDRLLVAQAMRSRAGIISVDKKLDLYDIERLW